MSGICPFDNCEQINSQLVIERDKLKEEKAEAVTAIRDYINGACRDCSTDCGDNLLRRCFNGLISTYEKLTGKKWDEVIR